jgi:hypothetical protein
VSHAAWPLIRNAAQPSVPPGALPLYGGDVLLRFDAKAHSYTVTQNGSTFSVPSVTQIIGVIDKSGPLMQWAANCAADYLRANLKPGRALDEIEIDTLANDLRFNFRKVSGKAKSVGALAHAWIKSYLLLLLKDHHAPVPALPVNEQARNACRAALDWMAANNFAPLAAEQKIYSRYHRYAGTMDFPARINDRRAVLDWKTSSSIYPEYRLQIAAYAEAYDEMLFAGAGLEPVGAGWIVRLGKDDGTFEAVRIPREDARSDFRVFLSALEVYKWLHQSQESAR